MDIGPYTFDEFRKLAENFHGYAAPGLLVGGYMVEKAKAALPAGTLFEAVVESVKCLPDAVQLLSVCSLGNQRLKVRNLGRYAVTLYDKFTGKGFRVGLDPEKLALWPELNAWFFKLKPKKEQDSARLEQEIREAGDSICKIEAVTVKRNIMGQKHMGSIGVCTICGEAYPVSDGPICRGCQGEAPYMPVGARDIGVQPVRIVPVEEAVGAVAAHDMTRIEPGQFKGPEFRAGQRIKTGDICRLQRMGRFHIAVQADGEKSDAGLVHENEAALAFAKKMAGPGIMFDASPSEGKIDFRAAFDGLLCVNEEMLFNFNLVPHVMAATRQDATLVKKGGKLAGTRAIPLFLEREYFERAMAALDAIDADGAPSGMPLLEVRPLNRAKVGILVTGTEVFKGIIEDRFIPVISAKVLNLGCEVVHSEIVPDDESALATVFGRMLDAGADLVITTGGLSVDPDDITRRALINLGLEDVTHGVPVLPGTMSLVGKVHARGRNINVLGVPACALYHKTTFLDLVLPRILAGRGLNRREAARMASGGYCLGCKVCTWPKCSFGK